MAAPTAILPSLRTRPFTLAEARTSGLTDRMLRGQRFRRVFAYVYVCADVPDTPLVRLAAAMLRAPHAFATDLSAAHVLGVPVPDDPITYLGIRRGDPRVRAAGIRVREYADPPPSVVHDGYAVTAAPHVFIQLTDRLSLLDRGRRRDGAPRSRLAQSPARGR